MKIVDSYLGGKVFLMAPTMHADDRGYFFESFSKRNLIGLGIYDEFVQDNQSKSVMGTIRGLHFQKWPGGQSKLVRCTHGRIRDVVVDINPSSKDFKKWFAFDLSEENRKMVFIPNGFAHGFEVLSSEAVVQYKVSSYYDPDLESGIAYNDPDLKIYWETSKPIVSIRDEKAPTLMEFLEMR